MPSTSPIVLILGAGSNVGHHVALAFAAKGYKVALSARKVKESDDTPDQIHIPSDLSNATSVETVFTKVKASFGIPSVVVYNGGSLVGYYNQELLTEDTSCCSDAQ